MKLIRTRSIWLPPVLLMVLAAGLRLYQLGDYGMWVDELFTIQRVTDDGRDLSSRFIGYAPTWLSLKIVGADLSVSRYEPWTWLDAGIGAGAARLGSAVVGILSIPVLMLVARPVIGARASIIYGLLLAVAPWHLYWSQNARFYAIEFVFYNLALFLYYRATLDQSALARHVRMGAAILCIAAAFMSHPTAIFIAGILVGDFVLGLIYRQPVRVGVVGWTGAAIASFFAARTVLDFYTNQSWLSWRTQNHTYSPVSVIQGFIYMVHPVIVLAAAAGGWLLWRKDRRLTLYLSLGAVMPMLLLLLASIFSYSHFRYAFVALAAVLALAAIGLADMYEKLRPQVGRLAAACPAVFVVASCVLMCLFYYRGGEGFRLRWNDAFEYVAQHAGESDIIYTDYWLGGGYYLQRDDLKILPESDVTAGVDQPTWFVVMSRTESSTSPHEDTIREYADLEAYFDTRIEAPYSSIRIYRYLPPEVVAAKRD